MNREVAIPVSKDVIILRILAVIALVIGVILEIKGFGAIAETLIVVFGLFLASEIRRGNEVLRAELRAIITDNTDKIIKAIEGTKK
jgi:hypothetical protein